MKDSGNPASKRNMHNNDKAQPPLLGEDDFDLSLPGRIEERKGSLPGDLRVRIVKSKDQDFKRVAAGELEATETAEQPRGNVDRALFFVKRLLIGVPIPTTMAEGERISNFKALALLSSDAISSVAFASEAILINLVAAFPA